MIRRRRPSTKERTRQTVGIRACQARARLSSSRGERGTKIGGTGPSAGLTPNSAGLAFESTLPRRVWGVKWNRWHLAVVPHLAASLPPARVP